jgi:DNA-binding NtrC family response regulator
MKDIPILTEHFISKFNSLTGKNIKGLTEDAYRIVMDYDWPGNVRELENSIEHAFVVCNKKLIDIFDLPQDIRLVSLSKEHRQAMKTSASSTKYIPLDVHLVNQTSFRIITKDQLENILAANKFNRKQTAKNLGISTVALWKKMKKFGIIV